MKGIIIWTVLVLFITLSSVDTKQCRDSNCSFKDSVLGCHWAECPRTNNQTKPEECSKLGCCFVGNNSYVQGKNISANCIRRVTNSISSSSKGQCKPYILNTTYCRSTDKSDNSTRYFDKTYNETGTIDILGKFHQIISSASINEYCKNVLLDGLCEFIIPKCIPNSAKGMEPCREDCEFIFKDCFNDVYKLLGALEWFVLQKDINFSHINIPYECDGFNYSYELMPPKTCAKIYPNATRTPPASKDSNDSKMVIIIASVAGCVLVLVVATILLIKRKRGNQKLIEKTEMSHISNMTSIREHLRADTVNTNPLEELLASSKPGELLQYPLDCVEYIKELGEGQFGKVFQGRVHGIVKGEDSTDVAVKCLKEGSSESAKGSFNQEVALMSVLQHDNILRLLAVSTEEEPYCMIFEFMENGDLNEFLRRWEGKDYLTDSQLIKICKYIASGMEYLASKKFLHRDLATRNCLVGQNLMVKIADFGMSRNVYHSDYYRVGGEAMLPIRWMPPESLLYGKFTVASDVYSFGVVMWEVFSFAIQPFYGYSNEEVIEFIKKGVLLPTPEDCPEWIYSIMLACWKRDPEERLTFTKALQWLKGKHEEAPRQKATTSGLEHYDKVPAPVQRSTGYDRITTDSGYDKVWNSNNNTEVNKEETNPPSYVNIQPERTKQATNQPDNSRSNDPPQLKIIPSSISADSMSSQPGSPTSPGTTNNAFDDDEAMLLKLSKSSTSVSAKEGDKSTKTKSLTSLTSKRNKSPKLDIQKSNSVGRNPRAFIRSSTGGRSIKEVMRDGPRYVSSEDIRKSESVKSKKEIPSGFAGETGYHSAFRPTSEFMQFHGYGESIQANNPDEAKLIKKIIEER